MPDISILIPHWHDDNGDRAFLATLPYLMRHTTLDYELIVTAHHEREFPAWNDMAYRANAEYIVFMVTDVFCAAGWDKALWDVRDYHTLAVMTIIESGVHALADFSLGLDCGRTPEQFNADKFEAYAATNPTPPDHPSWAFPWMINRDAFLRTGGFRVDLMPSQMTDHLYWVDWQKMGRRVVRAPSYGYHLGAWTLTGDQR